MDQVMTLVLFMDDMIRRDTNAFITSGNMQRPPTVPVPITCQTMGFLVRASSFATPPAVDREGRWIPTASSLSPGAGHTSSCSSTKPALHNTRGEHTSLAGWATKMPGKAHDRPGRVGSHGALHNECRGVGSGCGVMNPRLNVEHCTGKTDEFGAPIQSHMPETAALTQNSDVWRHRWCAGSRLILTSARTPRWING